MTNVIQIRDKEGNALYPITDASLVSGLANVATSGSYNDLSDTPTPPAPEIFWATYGTTTASEIASAVTAGKVIMCTRVSSGTTCTYRLTVEDSNYYWFVYGQASTISWAYLRKSDDLWVSGNVNAEQTTNKVTSWQTTPSDSKYPSEKLVKDSIDAVDKVFWATYGTTTASEIDAAVAAGKIVLCSYNDFTYVIVNNNNTAILFGAAVANNNYYLRLVRSNNTWTNTIAYLQASTERVNTLSGNETANNRYPTTKAVADALGKMGVIRQTQTWTQAADGGYDYTMSNPVRGLIPQANIDLFESAGAVFNEQTGYFELNGLTDVSYEEVTNAYNAPHVDQTLNRLQRLYVGNEGIRSNFFAKTVTSYGSLDGGVATSMCLSSMIEVVAINNGDYLLSNSLAYSFSAAIYLKRIVGTIYLASAVSSQNLTQTFNRCYSLEELYLRRLGKDVSFSDSPRLTAASVAYMVSNAGTATITITLHATAYARATADPAVQAALAAHTNVTLASN